MSRSGAVMGSVLVLCGACDEEPASAPALSPEEAEARAEAIQASSPPTAPAAVPSSSPSLPELEVSEPVRLVLVWEGIGELHKGFFSDSAATTALAAELGSVLVSPVDVTIRYDSQDLVGDILIKLSPDQLRQPLVGQGDRIPLQGLAPVTTALARYRSTVAGRFDYRVESFRVRLESYRGSRVCQFELAGEPPPDGKLISPCVGVNGQQQCGEPSAEGVLFSAAVAADLRACLDMKGR